MISKVLSLLFLFAMMSGLNAQMFSFDSSIPDYDDGPRYNAISITMGVVLMGFGLILTFAGKRFFKVLLAIQAFFVFAIITLMIILGKVEWMSITTGKAVGIGFGCVAVGIIGAIASYFLYKVGVFIMGFFCGAYIGSFIMRVAHVEKAWAVVLVACIFGLIIGIVAVWMIHIMLVVGTAFNGSNYFMLGVDSIANKGFSGLVDFVNTTKSLKFSAALWGMIGSFLVLGILGCIVQFKFHHNRTQERLQKKADRA